MDHGNPYESGPPAPPYCRPDFSWDEVMDDFFPDASTEEEIEAELDDIWND